MAQTAQSILLPRLGSLLAATLVLAWGSASVSQETVSQETVSQETVSQKTVSQDTAVQDVGTQDTAGFAKQVQPFLVQYCADCHGPDEQEAGLAFEQHLRPAEELRDLAVWEKALRMLEDGEMPPEDADQPTPDELQEIIQLVEAEIGKFDCRGKIEAGRVTIRRLNRVEYNNTVRDLFGIELRPADDFPSDDVGAGFDNIADVLTISPILVEKYLLAAEQIVEQVFASKEAKDRLYTCDPDSVDPAKKLECYQTIIEDFLLKAYRRPPTVIEIERLFRLALEQIQAGASEEEAVAAIVQVTLASPHFLFRIELDSDQNKVRNLNDFELATRLSYFLWSSMPDDELFALAADGKLSDPKIVEQQVRRMIASDKSRALVDNFAGQWLQLRDLETLTPDPARFPDYDTELQQAMRVETEKLFESVIREDRSVLDFLNADYTFLNERLARHYGVSGVDGPEFRRVALDERRRGILTHASILTLTSNPTRTSPVKRGKWILDNILGDPPPPPAPGVMDLEEQPELLGSLRERMEQHRADPSCAVCHRRMDALGFGLENFDAIGAWRTTDGKHEINSSGALPGNLSFSGPAELMSVLTEHKREDFSRCLIRKMLTYGLGRELTELDRCVVDEVYRELAAGNFQFSRLVTAVVRSKPFMMRGAQGDLP